tara:strand:+ start:41 stop:286 length:246 start_codon:yes stop_codon:yes gene_type:complete
MDSKENEIFIIDDSVIGHIAKLLQVSLITGTDIVDHMRMIRLRKHTREENNLVLNDEYRDIFDSSLEKMIENAKTVKSENQ